LERLGEQAMELALRENSTRRRILRVAGEVVIRESTGRVQT
jgi:LacI family transcriptional regulator